MPKRKELMEVFERSSVKKMTPRMWELYRFLYEHRLDEKPLTQKEICEALPVYEYRERKNSTDRCSVLWDDVAFINNHDEVDKIIITEKYTYRLGTEQECKDYAEKMKSRAVLVFKRYWNIMRKIKRDGRGKLLSNQGNPITEESLAKRFNEAFVFEDEFEDVDFESERK